MNTGKSISFKLFQSLQLGLAFSCAFTCLIAVAQTEATRPNIVLVVADDHGMRDMGCYGNTAIHTPNLDYLASQGTRFTRAYATTPSCTASRSVILSGLQNHLNALYGHMHAYNHFRSHEFLKSLPVYLEELAQYHTVRIGKYHVAPDSVYRFQTTLPDAHPRNPVKMAEVAAEYLASLEAQPFFLYFCTHDPHRSSKVVDAHPLQPNTFGNKAEGFEGVEEWMITEEKVQVPWYLPDLPATRAELVQYYQSVNRVDQGVGKLIEALKAQDKWDNTLIFYLSDNGIAFQGAKTNIYEPGINLPFLVKNVNGKHKGQVSKVMVSWADITPTILDYAGVYAEAEQMLIESFSGKLRLKAPMQGFHGTSLKPLLEKETTRVREQLLVSHTFHEITMYYPMRAVFHENYKLIFNIAHPLPFPHASDLWASATWQAALKDESQVYGGKPIDTYTYRPRFELFDLEKDPHEIHNLALNEAYSDILEKMKDMLLKMQLQTHDPWAIKWEHE